MTASMTMLYWATGTWWIPMLLILVVWRYLHIPLEYDPLYWGTVFPLGMYAVWMDHPGRARRAEPAVHDLHLTSLADLPDSLKAR